MSIIQIVEERPPRAREKVHFVLFTERVHDAPVLGRHAEPFAIARADVDVNGAEVVVLLVAGRSRARHFHVQLNAVHTEDGVADVREEVAR